MIFLGLISCVTSWVSDKSKNGLFKYELNNTATGILENKKIIKFTESFNIPTTFDIFHGNIYFVTNTQMDNFDEKTNKALDLNKLQPYILMKTRVK